MNTQNKHRVALQSKEGRISLFQSSFERAIGDTIDGKKVMAVFSTLEDQNNFVEAVNRVTRANNREIRLKNRMQEARFWSEILQQSPALLSMIKEHQSIISLLNSQK